MPHAPQFWLLVLVICRQGSQDMVVVVSTQMLPLVFMQVLYRREHPLLACGVDANLAWSACCLQSWQP